MFLRILIVLFGISASGWANNICGIKNNSFECCQGYSKDEQGECTIPICTGQCGTNGQCIRPNTCYCSNGRVAYSCETSNEQQNDKTNQACLNDCNRQGTCLNGKCKCEIGFEGASCEKETTATCYLNISRGICVTPRSRLKLTVAICCSSFGVAWGNRCQPCVKQNCPKGFEEIDGICKDIDECLYSAICSRGHCTNTRGSFRCDCYPGNVYDKTEGDCVVKKDICENACGSNMDCQVLPTQVPYCKCKQGYSLTKDNKSCYKSYQQPRFDFCKAYGSHVCPFGTCINNDNNYICRCSPGYISSGDRKSCKRQIDYCKLYEKMLCTNGRCISTGTTYVCQCNPGYSLTNDKKKCISVCDLYGSSLCPNGNCITKSDGNYQCQCHPGYTSTKDNKQCRRMMNDQSHNSYDQQMRQLTQQDSQQQQQQKQQQQRQNQQVKSNRFSVDYCAYKYYEKQCLGGQCINMESGYKCLCLSGFQSIKNGQACKKKTYDDANQISNNYKSLQMHDGNKPKDVQSSYCEKYGSFVCRHGKCVESGSSYNCKCNSGYSQSSDGKSCTDINECVQNEGICGDGSCTNSPGSYQCSCYDGFTIHYVMNIPKCYDRNECEEDRNLCTNGKCVNNWGSFKCLCNSGFTLSANGKQCIQINNYRRSSIKSSYVCSQCRGACNSDNSKEFICNCPNGLDQVLNLGICAPLSKVIDIRFDVPRPVTNNERLQQINFDLKPDTNIPKFISQVIPQYHSVMISGCEQHQSATDGLSVLCYIQEI